MNPLLTTRPSARRPVGHHALPLLLSAWLLAAAGCVQLPTEQQGAVDTRPQLSFALGAGTPTDAQVLVDGQPAGKVGDFLAGKGALRLLQGWHQVRVTVGTEVMLDQKVFLDDGVSKTLITR